MEHFNTEVLSACSFSYFVSVLFLMLENDGMGTVLEQAT
jgi:hypothetical protein